MVLYQSVQSHQTLNKSSNFTLKSTGVAGLLLPYLDSVRYCVTLVFQKLSLDPNYGVSTPKSHNKTK